jgi:hypothetical protein
MDGAVVRTGAHGNIAIGRKDNGERDRVGGGGSSQRGEYRLTGEDRSGIDRDDVGTEIFTTDIAYACRGGAGDNTGDIAAPADVTSCDLKTEGWMVALDGLRDGVEAMKRVVGHLKVERGQHRAVSGNVAIRGQEAESLNVGRGVHKVVHTLVETSVSGGFHNGTGQVKIVQNFERARISQENTKSRIRNNTAIPSGSRADMDAASEGT